MIAAINPHPCGYFQSDTKPCTCASAPVTKYQKRISGTLLDRIDIHLVIPHVDYEKPSGDRLGERSEAIRKRVQVARNIQHIRFSNIESSYIVCNADIRVGEIRQFCRLQNEGHSLMRAASHRNLSARVSPHPFDKLRASLKLVRNIADLAGCEEISIYTFGRGAAIQTEADDGIRSFTGTNLLSAHTQEQHRLHSL